MSHISRIITLAALFWLIPALGHAAAPATAIAAAPAGGSLEIRADQLQFEFGSQDGAFTYPCTHQMTDPVMRDWEITCGDPQRPGTTRHYTLHLRVFLFLHNTTPKMNFQILHWITDQQVPVTDPGHFVGSTVWFRLNDLSGLHSLDVSQDVENTNSLRMSLKLN